ncbi:DUF732 domain-containing protein [Mycobacterium ostraviense]|nr:DUF732 domain-containing protein [Mycobacterium ostraviense]
MNFATPQAAIVAGHQACDELDQGWQGRQRDRHD